MKNYYAEGNVVHINGSISVEGYTLLKKLGYIIKLYWFVSEV